MGELYTCGNPVSHIYYILLYNYYITLYTTGGSLLIGHLVIAGSFACNVRLVVLPYTARVLVYVKRGH